MPSPLPGARSTEYTLRGSALSTPAEEPAYPPIAELRAEWNAVHAKLVEALEHATEAQLLADAPFPLPQDDRSVLGLLSFLAYHEARHMGSMGSLRVQLGLEHTHVLALPAPGFLPPAEPAPG